MPTIRCSFWTALFLSLTLVAFNAQAQDDDHPTTVEIARLPTFCWGQFKVPDAKGPEFNMPSAYECSWGMNHYCTGLINLLRAKSAPNKNQRLFWLGRADGNVRYTENAIKDFPKCSLREHIAASRAEVNNLMAISGGKRPKAQ